MGAGQFGVTPQYRSDPVTLDDERQPELFGFGQPQRAGKGAAASRAITVTSSSFSSGAASPPVMCLFAVLDLIHGGPGPARVSRDPGGSAVPSNLLLVPLDRRGKWYRYHHLFRDMLRAERHRLQPGLIPVLQRRAAGWCARNDLPEEALEYSMAAGDIDESLAWWRNSWCLPTGKAGSPPSSGGFGGGRIGAGSRGTDGRGTGCALLRVDGAAGRGRAVGRRG